MVRVNNFRGFGLDTSDVLSIAADIEAKYSRTRLRCNDVLITVVGTVGQVAVVSPSLAGWNVARAVAVIRPKDEKLARWIALALRAPESQRALGVAANTTVQTTINLKDLRKLAVPIPERQEREAIELLLGSLDDRIDVLRQTNATLEAIAQALFKSWFIDFDPVRAKQAGREPEGMDAATAALFPAEFEESTLGLIPKGWRVSKLSDLCDGIFSGGTPDTRKPEYWNGTLPWFSSGETRETVVIGTDKHITEAAVANSSTRLARPGDVLIASAGQGQTRGQTSYCALDTYINQSVVSVRTSREAANPAWTFYNLARRYDELRGISDSHSIRGSLTTKLLASLRVIAPSTMLMQRFGAIAEPLLAAQAGNRRCARSLAELRDTLLPRLISGKLRLPEVKEQLEDVLA